jgi:hypothetical protein
MGSFIILAYVCVHHKMLLVLSNKERPVVVSEVKCAYEKQDLTIMDSFQLLHERHFTCLPYAKFCFRYLELKTLRAIQTQE